MIVLRARTTLQLIAFFWNVNFQSSGRPTIDRVHHMLKDKYSRVLCSAELKREKYCLRDKFGKPTQLGRVVKDLVEQDLCNITFWRLAPSSIYWPGLASARAMD